MTQMVQKEELILFSEEETEAQEGQMIIPGLPSQEVTSFQDF